MSRPSVSEIVKELSYTDNDIMDVYRMLPTVMSSSNVRKVQYYQLWFKGTWVQSNDNTLMADPTDRFYELCDQLSLLVVKSILYEGIDIDKASCELFDFDKDGKPVSVNVKYRSYQDFVNIIGIYLPPTYKFGIEYFTIDH